MFEDDYGCDDFHTGRECKHCHKDVNDDLYHCNNGLCEKCSDNYTSIDELKTIRES
jgi:hypothetical protein